MSTHLPVVDKIFIKKTNKIFLFDFYSYFFIAFVNYLWFFIAFMLIDICIFAVESEHILSRLCVE